MESDKMESDKMAKKEIVLATADVKIAVAGSIVGMEVMTGCKEEFNMLFADIGDEKMLNAICKEVSDDLQKDIHKLALEIIAIIENKGIIDKLTKEFSLGISLVLNESNEVRAKVSSDLSDCIIIDDEMLHILAMIEGIEYVYEVHYGLETAFKWGKYIRMGFNNQEEFRDIVLEKFRAYQDLRSN